MKIILVIVHHRPERSPGQRFRFEQYMDFLAQNGYKIIFSNLISEQDDAIYYSKGKYFKKFCLIIKYFFHRLNDLKLAQKSDIVFIYREAFMLGTTFFEKRFAKTKAKIIFDFDDAIWLNDTSDANKRVSWLKNPKKTEKICKLSDLVIAGNQYLANYAQQFNNNVKIIPTTLNLIINNNPKNPNSKLCIGWTGSDTTLKHFYFAIPLLKKLKEKFGEKIYFKVIANRYEKQSELEVKFSKWTKETEIKDILEFDIGIMPLPDDKWSKGKCGFKGLQCMALKIPVVMSAVGVNCDIIQSGENGYLATSEQEWFDCLSELIVSEELRKKIGEKGFLTVKEKYSFDAWKDRYLELFSN